MVLDVGFMRPLLVWRGYWIDGENVMSKETGGQVFPCAPRIESKNTEELGITLRDYFAVQVMKSEIARGGFHNAINVSAYAYQVADAMLMARNS